MRRYTSQQGATLVMIIGIIATLLILSAAMIGVVWNTRHATSSGVTQVKAFNIAEAGLDAGQQALWLNWPTASSTVLPSVPADAFRSEFASYPDPRTGQFIDVQFFDNTGSITNPGINMNSHRDENGPGGTADGYMWVVSRASTGTRSAKVMSLVQKVQYQPTIKSGVAIATAGLLDLRGTGNQPVIGLDPPATAASAYCGTLSQSGQPDVQSGIGTVTGTTQDMITQEIFPDEVLTNLIAAANGAGKEYPTINDVPASAWASTPRIIVIDSGGIDLKKVPDTDPVGSPSTIWSQDDPGILIVMGGDLNSTGQNKTLYGIVYLESGLILGGNAEIHGMVVARTSAWAHGTRAIVYNQNVLDNLNKPVVLSVKQVPNTWRELPAN
jgi:hypothetical protein